MISVTAAEFEKAVEVALRSIPAEFERFLDNVMIEIKDRPGREAAEMEEPDDILGLYVGTPIEDRMLEGLPPMPDCIYIYRQNLCDMCESKEELIDEIRITVLHEIGHHFGLDEDRLDELGYA